MTTRLINLGLWALLGAALTYVTVGVFDLFGLILIIALVVVGLAMFVIRSYDQTELVGLAGGPAVLFAIFGELDDAPGLVLIGLVIFASAAAVYVSQVRRQPASTA